MQLHDLKPARGSRKGKKLVGRGRGCGRGQTSGRGENGQGSREGRGVLRGSEGGQIKLIRRLPKVGFRSKRPIVYKLVKLADLVKIKDNAVVDAKFLLDHGLIKNAFKPYKILGDGEVKKAFTVQAYSFSKTAEEKIKGAGGKVEIIDTEALKKQMGSPKE